MPVRSRSLALQIGDPLASIARRVAQQIQLVGVACADEAAIGERRRAAHPPAPAPAARLAPAAVQIAAKTPPAHLARAPTPEINSSAARKPAASATRSRGSGDALQHAVDEPLQVAIAASSGASARATPSRPRRRDGVLALAQPLQIEQRLRRASGAAAAHPLASRVASSTQSSEPLTLPPRPLSKSSRLRRVWASRVMKPLML